MSSIHQYHLALLTALSLSMISCASVDKPRVMDDPHKGLSSESRPSSEPEALLAEEDEFGDFEDEFGALEVAPVFDPLSGYNRGMTRFNDGFFDWVVYPVAEGYNFVVPKGGRVAVSRFFKNLFFPIRFVNNVLQLKYDKAAIETGRFIVNSTVGLLGFFDPAISWLKLKPQPEDFGQTLGFYGVGSGFHIVLPILGPSNLRDTLGMIPDVYATPLSYLSPVEAAYASEAYRKLNDGSLRLGEYQSLRRDALDLYLFLRDTYERNRTVQIEE